MRLLLYFSTAPLLAGHTFAGRVSRWYTNHGVGRLDWLVAFAVSWLMLAPFPSHAADALTLDQVLTTAEQNSTLLRTTCALQSAAEGELNDTRAPLWNNPAITMEHRRRQLSQLGGPDVQRADTGIGVSQTFELGGQQAARREAAKAGINAVEKTIEDTRREVRAEAETRFAEVLVAQQRVQVDEQALDVLRRGAELVGKRVQAGEDTRLDGNLALVEAERAANQLSQAKEQLIQARSELASFLQIDLGEVQAAQGTIDNDPVQTTLTALLASANKRPKILALTASAEMASHRLDVERGAVYPDLTVGLSSSPERGIDGQDRITTLSVSLPLPLFRRNASGIGRALTELDKATIERQSAGQTTRASVTALWQRLQSLQQRVDRLQQVVLPSLEENQKLSVRALQAGEIGLPQFLLTRRQLLDSQMDLLTARAERRLTRIALEKTAGWPEVLEPLARGCLSNGLQ